MEPGFTMVETKDIQVGDQTLHLEYGKVGKQANGAVTARQGDSVVFAAATMSSQPRTGIDFFPLTCDYEERMYSVGKIPGGFYKREGRPSERGILTSRLMDRPIRPLFPDGMRNDVQVIAIPVSVDLDHAPDILAINAASAALTLSDIPWNGPVGAVRVGRINDEFVLNPNRQQINEGDLDLVVAGTREAIIMVEAGAREISEEQMLEAMLFGHRAIVQITEQLQAWRDQVGKPKTEPVLKVIDPAVGEAVKKGFTDEIRAAVQNPDKAAREAGVDELKKEILAKIGPDFPEREAEVSDAIEKVVKGEVRRLILEDRRRPDGRQLDEVRPITCEVGLLPRAHGSGLFTRGQTQVLSVVTLGGTSEDQLIDGLGEEEKKTYMHHYNFPPFSVGEVRPLRGPGRRDIGHGALAERAVKVMLPPEEEFPYVIRIVSEVLESNGSTSMGSVCGSTLALLDAGVPLQAPVAGVAMGLMTDGDKYAVLTDIQGMEDFGGDMDFKVAGTRDGITAIQMDTKISGIPVPVLRDALQQALQGRLFIMDQMLAAIAEPREAISPYAPRIFQLEINPERIGELIGPGGKTIKKIQAETGAKIDVEQDGRVFVATADAAMGELAVRMIEGLVKEANIGEVYPGQVTRLMGKGAMVEYAPGKEGLILTEELSWHRLRRPDDVVRVGDKVQVKVVEIDSQGRVNLSRKALIDRENEPEPPYANEPLPPGGFGGGGGRGGFGGDRGGFGGDRDRGPRRGGFEGRGDRDRGPRPDRGPGGDRDRGPRPDRGPGGERGGDGGGRGGNIPPRGDRGPQQGGPSGEAGIGARFRPPKRDS
jgi:polyribonucleotide nucleotidyltransferase